MEKSYPKLPQTYFWRIVALVVKVGVDCSISTINWYTKLCIISLLCITSSYKFVCQLWGRGGGHYGKSTPRHYNTPKQPQILVLQQSVRLLKMSWIWRLTDCRNQFSVQNYIRQHFFKLPVIVTFGWDRTRVVTKGQEKNERGEIRFSLPTKIFKNQQQFCVQSFLRPKGAFSSFLACVRT